MMFVFSRTGAIRVFTFPGFRNKQIQVQDGPPPAEARLLQDSPPKTAVPSAGPALSAPAAPAPSATTAAGGNRSRGMGDADVQRTPHPSLWPLSDIPWH